MQIDFPIKTSPHPSPLLNLRSTELASEECCKVIYTVMSSVIFPGFLILTVIQIKVSDLHKTKFMLCCRLCTFSMIIFYFAKTYRLYFDFRNMPNRPTDW
jgi:hypothetical protein